MPLFVLSFWFQLQLRSVNEFDSNRRHKQQYGIIDLLILTGLAGAALAAGKFLFNSSEFELGGFLIVAVLFALAAVTTTLPLLLAALRRRNAIVSLLLALLFAAVVSTVEIFVMLKIGGGGKKAMESLIWTNIFSSALVLIVAGSVRLCGFVLATNREIPSTDKIKSEAL